MGHVFGHGVEWHEICHSAVAAITQYQLDNGSRTLLDPFA